MNRAELAAELAYRTGLTKKDSMEAVNSLFDIVCENVCNGEKVNIKGFGSFEAKAKKARKARNPVTKEQIELPATIVPAFKPGDKFRAAVLKLSNEEKNI